MNVNQVILSADDLHTEVVAVQPESFASMNQALFCTVSGHKDGSDKQLAFCAVAGLRTASAFHLNGQLTNIY